MMSRLTRSSYTKITLITILCLTICGTLTGAIHFVERFINPLGSDWGNDDNTSTGSFTIDASTVNDISISWAAGKVTVKVVDDEETNGLIQARESERSRPALRWRNVGGKLEIDYGNVMSLLSCSFFNFNTKELTLLIPESYRDKLNSFSLDTVSGEHVLSGIGCKNLNVHQVSGNVHFEDFSAQNLTTKIISGTFSYNGKLAGALDVDQTSGNTTFDIKSSNPDSAKVSLTSGDMRLLVPNPNFCVELDKVSGSFASNYDLMTKGNTYYTSEALGVMSGSDVNHDTSDTHNADGLDGLDKLNGADNSHDSTASNGSAASSDTFKIRAHMVSGHLAIDKSA